jgi:hypothetical protein
MYLRNHRSNRRLDREASGKRKTGRGLACENLRGLTAYKFVTLKFTNLPI